MYVHIPGLCLYICSFTHVVRVHVNVGGVGAFVLNVNLQIAYWRDQLTKKKSCEPPE